MSEEINEFVNEYEKALNAFNAARQELMKDLQDKLKSSFKKFFELNPEIQSIEWTQYTPYFNDGEECIFSVNEMFFRLVGDDDSDLYDLESKYTVSSYALDIISGKYTSAYYSKERALREVAETEELIKSLNVTPERIKELEQNFKNFKDVLSKLNDDVYEDVFGDHALITATKDGFEVEYYEHD